MEQSFFETILDNMTDGVYILDDKGNYIFVNSTYVQLLNMPKSTLLNYNVHDFLKTGQIDVCVSDIVYKEKHQIVMFQSVFDPQAYGRKSFRQMIISTPILDGKGNVRNILAIVRPLDTLNALYQEAGRSKDVIAEGPHISDNEQDRAIIAVSASMRGVLELAKNIADVDSAVLITGESGTGKEVLAQYLHRNGARREKNMIVINCASLPESLLEAELFGYEKGSFTGALTNGKRGLFEEANGGVVFLDEINSLPLNLQGKLLRAIENKAIKRIGATKEISIDFRLFTASNEDLYALVQKKEFRLDLYYRLSVINLDLPPLRDRRDDIVPLAEYFLKHFCHKHKKQKVFSPYTLRSMLEYDWPGNVRQLRNFVERSVVITVDEVIEIGNVAGITGTNYYTPRSESAAFPAPKQDDENPQPQYERLLENGVSLEEYLNSCERDFLSFVLSKSKSTYEAADALKTSQTSVVRRKKKYNL